MALNPPRRSMPPNAGEEALQRAAFALQGQRPDEAARIAGDILKKNPDDVRAMQILGTALLLQGRGKEAVAPLEQFARRTNDPAAVTQLAMALRQAGRNEEAMARFENAIKRIPPFPPAFLEFGNLLTMLGRHDRGDRHSQTWPRDRADVHRFVAAAREPVCRAPGSRQCAPGLHARA